MLIYLALALLPVFLSLFLQNTRNNRSQRYLLYILCGLGMFLLMALRTANMGSVDSLNYYRNYYDAMLASSWDTFFRADHFEIGFQFVTYTLAQVLPDPQWIFVFSSAFFTISILYFVEHNSDDPPLSLSAYISLGMMTFQMQGMRQAIAISICLFAFEQAKRKHLLRFLLLVGLAMLFHQTAIIFLPVYLLCRMKITQKNVCLTVAVMAIALLASNFIIDVANDLFDSDYTSVVESGGLVATAIYFIILLVCYLHYRHNHEDAPTPLVLILIVATGCYLMRYVGAQAAERISFYFSFAQVGLLPKALKLLKREHQRYMYLLIVALMVGLFAYRLSSSYFIPYQAYWNVPILWE